VTDSGFTKEPRQQLLKAAFCYRMIPASASLQARCYASRSSFVLPLLLACLLYGLPAGEAQAGDKGIAVIAQAFLKVQNPDRNIPPLDKEGTPPRDIAPRHLTVGPFGPTDGRGAGGLYLRPEIMDTERVPELFGIIPVSEPSLEGMHGVEGWCYTAATPDDRTAVLLLYGLDKGDATIAVVSDVAFIRQPSLCARTPRVHAGLATVSGIRLGMSRAQVRAILGRPMAADSWRDGIESKKWEPLTPALKRKLGWDSRTTHRTRLQAVVVWYEKDTVIGFEVEEFNQDGPSPSLMGATNTKSE
jgi:hypothetical protein